MSYITGLFEVHITIGSDNEKELFCYVLNLKNARPSNIIRPKITCAQAFYGKCPKQLMLTCWLNSNSNDVVEQVKQISKGMADRNIVIKRVKIESMMSNQNVPMEADDEHYYEFHGKVKINSTDDWNFIAKSLVNHSVHLSSNTYSKTGFMQPIFTLRCYKMKYTDALDKLQVIVCDLEENGFELNGNIQKEYSVYDDNVFVDEDWLFSEKPNNFITRWSDNMLCSQ